jgi:hypothetical protein
MHTAAAAGTAVAIAAMGTIIPIIRMAMAALGTCETIKPDIAVTTSLREMLSPAASGISDN